MKFQKGNKMAKGRPPVPDDVRGLKLMNQRDVELLLNTFMDKSADELVKFSQDLKNPVKEILVARILVEAIRKGDENRLEFVLNRLLGKPKEITEHHVKLSYHNEIMHMIEEADAIDVTPEE